MLSAEESLCLILVQIFPVFVLYKYGTTEMSLQPSTLIEITYESFFIS